MEMERINPLDIEIRDIRFKVSTRLWNCLRDENMEKIGRAHV